MCNNLHGHSFACRGVQHLLESKLSGDWPRMKRVMRRHIEPILSIKTPHFPNTFSQSRILEILKGKEVFVTQNLCSPWK